MDKTRKCARGGINNHSVRQQTSSKFFHPITILIAALTLAVSGFACGGSEKDDPVDDVDSGLVVTDAGTVETDAGVIENDSGIIEDNDASIADASIDTDAGIIDEDASVSDECEPGHFGKNCDACTCDHGKCKEGKKGDGTCSQCDGNYWGENCDTLPSCNLEHGKPSIGISGTGKCISCLNDYSGENCGIAPTCVAGHGTVNSALTGDGKCSACNKYQFVDELAFWGENCEHDASTDPAPCLWGTLAQNGHCEPNSCKPQPEGLPSWQGEDCDTLPDGYMGDRQGNVYKTVKIGDQIWMATNMRDEVYDFWCEWYKPGYAIQGYGQLYNWENAQKVCPDHWKLPSKADFETLLTYVEANKKIADSAFLALIAKVDDWTMYKSLGSDEFGFGAYPSGVGAMRGGTCSDSVYGNVANDGLAGCLWSSDAAGSNTAFMLNFGTHETSGIMNGAQNNAIMTTHYSSRYIGVRCLKKSSDED